MKLHLRALLASLLILAIAACSNQTEPNLVTEEATFSFTVDPNTQVVSLVESAAFLTTLNNLECGEEPQTLKPSSDLSLVSYEYNFLAGNKLKIKASFKNETPYSLAELSFHKANTTSQIRKSYEPDAVAMLASLATTETLEFIVEHKGKGFTYEVLAKAIVECELKGEADLEVTKSDPVDPITLEQRAEEEGRLVSQVSLEDLEFA